MTYLIFHKRINMKLTKQFLSETSKYVNLADKVPHTITLLGEEAYVDRSGNKGIKYTVLEEGKEKMWTTTSRRLMTKLMNFEPNAVISVRRFGERFETDYEVKEVVGHSEDEEDTKVIGDNEPDKETPPEGGNNPDIPDQDSF